MNRNTRSKLGKETVEILEKGFYTIPETEKRVEIGELVEKCLQDTRTFSPNDLDDICAKNFSHKFDNDCLIEVTSESTLAAACRLICVENESNIICLNFASAKHPGGGFLSGSGAQEESLARSSALYASIKPQSSYYKANLACKNCFYTDFMIHSPRVPVIRNDADGSLLPDGPYLINVVTSPAVNVKGMKQTRKFTGMDEVRSAMFRRVEKLLALCAHLEHDTLILGAWGCGVFENDPDDVAEYFKQLLSPSSSANNNICDVDDSATNRNDASSSSNENAMNNKTAGRFSRCFKRIVFAILTNDPSKNNTLMSFRNAFNL